MMKAQCFQPNINKETMSILTTSIPIILEVLDSEINKEKK